ARVIEPADAEDMCQEVCLRCYLGREKLCRASTVGAWLMGIAQSVARARAAGAAAKRSGVDGAVLGAGRAGMRGGRAAGRSTGAFAAVFGRSGPLGAGSDRSAISRAASHGGDRRTAEAQRGCGQAPGSPGA